jgi:hypothetical protein
MSNRRWQWRIKSRRVRKLRTIEYKLLIVIEGLRSYYLQEIIVVRWLMVKKVRLVPAVKIFRSPQESLNVDEFHVISYVRIVRYPEELVGLDCLALILPWPKEESGFQPAPRGGTIRAGQSFFPSNILTFQAGKPFHSLTFDCKALVIHMIALEVVTDMLCFNYISSKLLYIFSITSSLMKYVKYIRLGVPYNGNFLEADFDKLGRERKRLKRIHTAAL